MTFTRIMSSGQKKRDELYNYLEEQGVETLIHWKRPVWEHKGLKLGQLNLPETESICKEVISLPMSTETTDENVEYTVECIRNFFM